MSDLAKVLSTHRELAEAATTTRERWRAKSLKVFAGRDWIVPFVHWPSTARHIAANDPQTVQAFISVAEAAAAFMKQPTLNGQHDLRAALDNLSSVLPEEK